MPRTWPRPAEGTEKRLAKQKATKRGKCEPSQGGGGINPRLVTTQLSAPSLWKVLPDTGIIVMKKTWLSPPGNLNFVSCRTASDSITATPEEKQNTDQWEKKGKAARQ